MKADDQRYTDKVYLHRTKFSLETSRAVNYEVSPGSTAASLAT